MSFALDFQQTEDIRSQSKFFSFACSLIWDNVNCVIITNLVKTLTQFTLGETRDDPDCRKNF